MTVQLLAVLAQTLREKPNGFTVQQILKEYPTISELIEASEEELQLISGIGPAKAKQIKAILELSHLLTSPIKQVAQIRSAEDAYLAVKGKLEFKMQEHFLCMALNTKHRILAIYTVSIGLLGASLVHPREVFRPLIRLSASACIVAHNHPSGDSTPSPEDIVVTKRLSEAGRLIEIELLDHIVVGSNEYTSLKVKGRL